MPHCAFRFRKKNHIISLFSATFSNLWNFVRLVNRQATNSPEFGICLGFFHDFARRSKFRRGPSKSRIRGNSNPLPKLHRFAPQLYTGRNKPWYIYQHFRNRRTNRLTNRSFFDGKVAAECRVWRTLYILSQKTLATFDFPEVILSFRATSSVDLNAVYSAGYFATKQNKFSHWWTDSNIRPFDQSS